MNRSRLDYRLLWASKPRCAGILMGILLSCASLHAQVSRDFAVNLKASVSDTAPHITLLWSQAIQGNITVQQVYRRLKGETAWGSPLATLSNSATSYTDATALPHVEYEYWMRRTLNVSPSIAVGYISAGVKVSAADGRGTLLLVVDDTMVAPLALEIAQLREDLAADGWNVRQINAPRTGTAITTKALIKAVYDEDPANVKMLYLLGHVPVPYSGGIAPDGHATHTGAWPADGYYGDMDGTWTDTSVNTDLSAPLDPRNKNVPGDNKFDQGTLPSLVELQVGRVDMSNMGRSPSASSSLMETTLLRRYLNKAHAYRLKLGAYAAIPRRSLIRDGFRWFNNSEPFAIAGWAGAFTGLGQAPEAPIDEAPESQWFSAAYAGGKTYLWGHGNGGGEFEAAGGLGNSADFGHKPSRVVFTSVFGSWHGDWDSSNNLMRSILAGNASGDSLGLCCFWTGRPNWFVHPLGMGETLGYMTRASMNSGFSGGGGYQPAGFSSKGVHLGLMGDPALRIHSVEPPRGLAASSASGQVSLTWAASTESGLQGYQVYRATTPEGPFAKLTASPQLGTSYTDSTVTVGQSYYYLVRTLKLESVPGGSYFNLSIGSPVRITASSAAIATPENPSDLVVGAQANPMNAPLSWADNSADETGFRIERKVNATGTWSPLATVSAGTTSHTDSGPFTAGDVYFYRVIATGGAGDSNASNMASFEASAGFIEFSSRTMKASKVAGTAAISVTRSGGVTGAVTVVCSTSNSTAVSGTHFTATTGTVSWADGESGTKMFNVPLTNTAAPQLARQFKVSLSSPGGGARLGVFDSMSVLIEDPTATLAAPWSQTLMGAVTESSPAVSAEGCIGSTLIGGALGGWTDSGSFISQSRTGDGSMTAYIHAPAPSTSWNIRMALMIRASLSVSANTAGVVTSLMNNGSGTYMVYRNASALTTVPKIINGIFSPCWLRLTRSGSNFTAEQSPDGVAWTTVGQTTVSGFPATAYWGIFDQGVAVNVIDSSADYNLNRFQNVTFSDLPVPGTPEGVSITGSSSNSLTLQWNTSKYSSGYRIEQRLEGGGFVQIANVVAGTDITQSQELSGLAADTAYEFRIVADNSTGSAPASSSTIGITLPVDSSQPLRPGFLNVSSAGGSVTQLDWIDMGTTETGFEIERRVANGNWTLLQSLPANSTSFSDTTSLPGVIYDYRVRATGVSSNSSWSIMPVDFQHAAVATVNHPAWSPGSAGNIFQAVSLTGRAYVPNGFRYYSTPPLPFMTDVNMNGIPLYNNFTGWLGCMITVGESPVTVTELGRWVVSGNTQQHAVKLVSASTGVDVPNGSVSVATAGVPVGFRYAPLANPVTLAANASYYIVSQETNGGDRWYDGGCLVSYPNGVATVPKSIYSVGSSGVYGNDYMGAKAYGPVSFKYSVPPAAFTTGHSMTNLRNDFSGWLGMKITVGSEDLFVSSLGRWVAPGNSGSHEVKLVNAETGVALASTSVATLGASPGQIQYAALSTPVTLSANTAYFLLSQETSGGDLWYDFSTPGSTTGYQSWLLANGLPMDASGDGSATASPADDGLANLVKYALGLAPSVSGNGGRLSYDQIADAGMDYLSLTYTRPEPAPSGINYTVEASPDLADGHWTAVGLVEIESTVAGGLRTITVRDSTSLSSAPKRFLRLRVSMP